MLWLDVDVCSFIHIQNLYKMDEKISEICFMPCHPAPLWEAEPLPEWSVRWASLLHPPHHRRCVPSIENVLDGFSDRAASVMGWMHWAMHPPHWASVCLHPQWIGTHLPWWSGCDRLACCTDRSSSGSAHHKGAGWYGIKQISEIFSSILQRFWICMKEQTSTSSHDIQKNFNYCMGTIYTIQQHNTTPSILQRYSDVGVQRKHLHPVSQHPE